MSWNIDEIFDLIVDRKASDVIFVPGSPPMIWVSGIMRSVEAEPLTAEDVEAVFLPLLNEDQRRRLQEVGDIDFAVPKTGVGRLRLNVHRQRGSLSVAGDGSARAGGGWNATFDGGTASGSWSAAR